MQKTVNYDNSAIQRGPDLKIYKLQLVLDTEAADIEALKKYGKVKNGITRDIIVPSNMTLHALHYAIQKLFGWENCHLHHFELPEEVFDEVAGDKFIDWIKYAGIYFRFPTDDNEDIYWDDDYAEGRNLKSWMKSKYNSSYQYHGMFEHFMEARFVAEQFVADNRQLRISIPFHEWMEMSEAERNKPRIRNIEDLTISEADEYFTGIGGIKEVLERLTIEEVFGAGKPTVISDKQYKDNLFIFLNAHNRYVEDNDENRYWEAVNPLNPKASPITSELIYEYDYGDGWMVRIRLDGVEVSTADTFIKGPVCVAADGLPVLDDVGGVRGYSEMLKGIHGEGSGCYDYNDPVRTKDWARAMGWTGRMSKPENML